MMHPASTKGDMYSLAMYSGKGGYPPCPTPIPVEPLQENPHPLTPTSPVDRDFCDPAAFLSYSPRPLDVSSAVSVTSRGESTTLRNLLFKKIAELHKVAAKTVNEDTDLEKIKLLFIRTVPTVEKLVREMEKYLRDYS